MAEGELFCGSFLIGVDDKLLCSPKIRFLMNVKSAFVITDFSFSKSRLIRALFSFICTPRSISPKTRISSNCSPPLNVFSKDCNTLSSRVFASIWLTGLEMVPERCWFIIISVDLMTSSLLLFVIGRIRRSRVIIWFKLVCSVCNRLVRLCSMFRSRENSDLLWVLRSFVRSPLRSLWRRAFLTR